MSRKSSWDRKAQKNSMAPKCHAVKSLSVRIYAYAQHAFMTATAFFSCSIGILRAGSKRSLSLALMTRTPFSRQAAMISDAFFSVWMPIIRPRPDTPSTPFAPVSSRLIYAERSSTPASIFSSKRFRTLIAPAQQTGFPPKVEPCVPAVSTFCTFSPSSVAPSGRPPARPLAVETISGWMP